MSADPDLCTRTEYLDWHLTPLPLPTPTTTRSPCPICLDPYSATNPPVALLECNHIFCRPCILAWFDSEQENAHTCPLDRTELFLPRFLDDPSRTVIHTARGPEVIAVHGLLTREGCRHVIRDLWLATARLVPDAGVAAAPDGACVLAEEGVLREVIRGVFPRGVATVFAAWPGLVQFARLMVGWHAEGGVWAHVWQGPMWLPSDELSAFVEAFYEACGADEEEEEE